MFFWVSLCLLALILVSCSGGYEQEYQFDYIFEEDQQDWVTDFADLPVDRYDAIYELDSGWGELPSSLEGNAIYLNGHNRSDPDLLTHRRPSKSEKFPTNLKVRLKESDHD
jgi:hypothetical protein